jgi:FkbM family methyltransferase
MDVFRYIFIDREYAPLGDLDPVELVVDCGAYAGYSSTYFLSLFPQCRIIAVEPDPGNFELLQRNLDAYADRTTAIHAAVWSSCCNLELSTETFRDGREWTRHVHESTEDGTTTIPGVDIPAVVASTDAERISLLKMDIEGAEAVVFRDNPDEWLHRVDNIVIELHDDSAFGNASQLFFGAISRHGFNVSTSGELTICKRATDHAEPAEQPPQRQRA